MRSWYFGGNGLKQYMYGHIEVVEYPWWLWLIEWWADRGCSWIPRIPFPNWPKMHFDKDDPSYVATPKEWYGDLSQLYCSLVCSKLINWVERHPKRKKYYFDVGWAKLKEVMYEHDKKFFDEMEAMDTQNDKENQFVSMPPEFAEVLEKHFWDLL